MPLLACPGDLDEVVVAWPKCVDDGRIEVPPSLLFDNGLGLLVHTPICKPALKSARRNVHHGHDAGLESGMSSPFSPSGYPLPSHRSWW